jgi:hypothetical protein
MAHAPQQTGAFFAEGQWYPPISDCADDPFLTSNAFNSPGSNLVKRPLKTPSTSTGPWGPYGKPGGLPDNFCNYSSYHEDGPMEPGHWICEDRATVPWNWQDPYSLSLADYVTKCTTCEIRLHDKFEWDKPYDLKAMCAGAPTWYSPPDGPPPTKPEGAAAEWGWILASVIAVGFLLWFLL